MDLLTADEMRALDRATIDGGHASGAELMERAGRGAVEAAERCFGPALALRVLVLCGPGNNGGDGFVAARHLLARGARVHVLVAVPRGSVRGDALAHLERLEAAGARPEFAVTDAEVLALASGTDRWDWAVDALLGTGASGEPKGRVAAAARTLVLLHAHGVRVLALDLPTGVSADTGEAGEHAVTADLTAAFGCLKRGHVLHPGRGRCGVIERIDIGLLAAERAGITAVSLAGPDTLAGLLPPRDPRAHKGTAGRVLVVGGAPGMVGAIVLAARAASRAGAGYVRVAAPAGLHGALSAQLVEQMPLACEEGPQRSLGRAALPAILEEFTRADAVAIGPGLSRHEEALTLARELLARADRPVVLDADALAAFGQPNGVLGSRQPGPRPWVLTPHLGEMARLTGETPATLESRRIDAAREWARRWSCVLVLKGAPTVVADSEGRASVNPTGNPGMATAGMGDVLTGTIAALIAQGLSPWDAARVAVYAHGAAGDLAAREIGPVGLVAGDVAERLPRALAALRPAAAT